MLDRDKKPKSHAEPELVFEETQPGALKALAEVISGSVLAGAAAGAQEQTTKPPRRPKAAKQGTAEIPNLLSSETACHRCGERIEAGEYRVYVVAVEHRPARFCVGETAGPGQIVTASLCDVCCGQTWTLPVRNPWFWEREIRADPSAGPASEDARHRATSLQGEAERRAAWGEQEDGGEGLSATDIEAEINSTNRPNIPQLEPPTEDDLRNRMSAFLRLSEAKSMPRRLRIVAAKWAEGETQAQIAKAVGSNQSSVSRWLDEAKALLYKSRR